MPLIEMEPQPNALDYPEALPILREFLDPEIVDQLLYEPPEKVRVHDRNRALDLGAS